MTTIAYNSCYGGFSLSRKAFVRLRELGNETALKEPDYGEMFDDDSGPRAKLGFGDHFCSDIARDDSQLHQVIRELGSDANGLCADLSLVEIPDNVAWEIQEYDGLEWVAEKHRTWS